VRLATALRVYAQLLITRLWKPTTNMKLEDLRKDNIGQIYAWFPKKGNDESSMLLITYPYYRNPI
jgi:hypothetical protein